MGPGSSPPRFISCGGRKREGGSASRSGWALCARGGPRDAGSWDMGLCACDPVEQSTACPLADLPWQQTWTAQHSRAPHSTAQHRTAQHASLPHQLALGHQAGAPQTRSMESIQSGIAQHASAHHSMHSMPLTPPLPPSPLPETPTSLYLVIRRSWLEAMCKKGQGSVLGVEAASSWARLYALPTTLHVEVG